MVQLFSSYFAGKVVSPEEFTYSVPSQSCSNLDLFDMSITNDDVNAKLFNLDANKSAGPDGFPPIFYKNCAEFLTKPLSLIFNSSLKTGHMPKKLKHAYLIPIHKSGSLDDVRNYKFSTRLNVLAKIMDSLMCDNLFKNYASTMSFPEQTSKKHSKITRLKAFKDILNNFLNNKGQLDVIQIDFCKAFYQGDPKRLLNKLVSMGFNNLVLKWFKSCLTERTQQVKISNTLSDIVHVTSPVFEGSLCSQLLFSILIGDIGIIDSSLPDDFKVWKEINNSMDCKILQNRIENIIEVLGSIGVVLDANDCSVMTVTRRTKNAFKYPYNIANMEITRKVYMQELGVLFDNKLKFSSHIEQICQKGRQICGLIIKNSSHFKKYATEVALYKSLVRPHLEYASKIWESANNNELHRLQQNFIYYLAKKYFQDENFQIETYENYLKLFKIEPIQFFSPRHQADKENRLLREEGESSKKPRLN